MRFRVLMATVVASIVTSGCYSTAPIPVAAPEPVNLQASADALWNATLVIFAHANIPIENMEKGSGFIGSGEMTATKETVVGGLPIADIVDCGEEWGVPHIATGTTFIAFTVLLQPVSDSVTTIRVRTAARNYDTTHPGNPNSRCESKGTFETMMIERIERSVSSTQ